jgi:hypothetical protein
MTRFTLLILIVISLILGSCTGNKNKPDGKNLIPEKALVAILTDVYLADGLLSLPEIRSKFAGNDSISTYISIIENHGYTKSEMDKTLEYYFIDKPPKLIEIYDKVLADLSERESLLEKEVLLSLARRENLWTAKENYQFPSSSGADSSEFNTILRKKGIYTLQFNATIFPDDQSVNPRLSWYLCSPDSITTGKRSYIEPIYYIKDGRQHEYSISISVPDTTKMNFGGFLYNFDNNPALNETHAWFGKISLYYSEAII